MSSRIPALLTPLARGTAIVAVTAAGASSIQGKNKEEMQCDA